MKITELDTQYFNKEDNDSWITFTPKEGYELLLHDVVVESYDIFEDPDYVTLCFNSGDEEYDLTDDIDGLHLFKVERTLIS